MPHGWSVVNVIASARILGGVAALTMAAVSVASAHHSAVASYEAERSIEIRGTVVELSWRNPHCHVYLDVTQGPFKGQKYTVELSSPEVLTNSGWSKTTMRPGDNVVIEVHPSRVGSPVGLCRNCALTVNGNVAKASGRETSASRRQ